MVIATLISISGTLSESSIPGKTADVLEWLRKKLKQPTLQFQGKCVHEDHSFAFFAVPSEIEDEQTNQHMLPPPHDMLKGTPTCFSLSVLNALGIISWKSSMV